MCTDYLIIMLVRVSVEKRHHPPRHGDPLLMSEFSLYVHQIEVVIIGLNDIFPLLDNRVDNGCRFFTYKIAKYNSY